MSASSVESSSLDSIRSSYVSSETETSSSDELGTDDFLTLLVAQIENQNPMDPADTSEFTSQLAEYSQLEQLISLNDKYDYYLEMEEDAASQTSGLDYVGTQVTGSVETMTIDDGSVTTGFYELSEPAEVVITILDSDGYTVKTLEEGQQEAGAYLISWDGTDDDGNELDDGVYSYAVWANTGAGYEEVSSLLTGTVDSVAYQNGKEYLVVSGVLLDPDSLTSVSDTSATSDTDSDGSVLNYLGTSVSSYYPIVQVDDGQVTGDDLGFYLESAQDVTVTVYDAANEAVATIEISAEDTAAGDNSVYWDALSDEGYQASDGLYYYTVETGDGAATTPVSGEVTGILTVNETQYLQIGDTGRLVSLSTITSVE